MSPAADQVLVLNSGSSSIKFALFGIDQDRPAARPALSGRAIGIGTPSGRLVFDGEAPTPLAPAASHPHHAAMDAIRAGLDTRLDPRRLRLVAHRVVHGGDRFRAPVAVDREVLATLRRLVPLAPLHQPFALDAIERWLDGRPGLPQVACFDTAFHHTLPRVEQQLPLPREMWARGLRRYGFHGLSYAWQAHVLPERHGDLARQRVLVAHLGSGASLCALHELRSVATTMGFSALDGLMMGTRCGSLDPGALLYLMQIEGLDLAQVGDLLYNRSGLLGVSGRSADPRDLLAVEATDEDARLALALFVRRVVREAGALVAVLGGLDLLVFTAGIGEHSAPLRERICADLGFLGIALDSAANAANAPVISTPGSRVRVAVEPADEEWIAARDALVALTAG
ncbi:MAG: acetate/propionate family kinase [Xanthomonadales bacterium]|nr:acetate/propionate family kinase [Xanthomonadales bacterium]